MAGTNSNYSVIIDAELELKKAKQQLNEFKKDNKLNLDLRVTGGKSLREATSQTQDLDNSTNLKYNKSHIHGVFDNDDFRRQVLNELRAVKGLTKLPVQINIKMQKERAYNNLAEVVRTNLDMEKLTKIMGAK